MMHTKAPRKRAGFCLTILFHHWLNMVEQKRNPFNHGEMLINKGFRGYWLNS